MKRLWPWGLAGAALVASYAALFRGEVQAARDLSGHVFPETFFLVTRWSAGHVPLWLPNARLGQPFLALLYTQVFYAPRLVTGLLFGHVLGPNVLHLFHAAWAFAGLYLAGRCFGLQRAFAFIGAAPFALSPFFSEFAQNLSFASTAAWAGWTAWAAEGLRRAPSLRSSAVLGLILGCAFHAGSPELWLMEVLLVSLSLRERGGVRVKHLALAVAWAGALSAVVALPAAELSRAWTQGGLAGATQWSVSGAQLLSIFIPDADRPRIGGYWNGPDQHFLFTLFIGALGTWLALLSLQVKRARPILFFAALALVLCVGRHFFLSQWLLAVPPFSLFRYPAKYAVGLLFGVSLLAGFGARRLVALSRRRAGILQSPQVLALVGLAIGLVVSSRWDWVREGYRTHAPWLLATTVLLLALRRRPVLLAIAVAAELVFAPVTKWDRVPSHALTQPSRLAPLLRDEGRISIRVDLDDHDPEACGPWDLEEHDPLLEGRDRLAGLRFVEEGLRATGGYGFRDPWRLGRAFSQGPGAFSVAGVSTFVRETWAPAPQGAVSVATTPIDDVWIWKGAPALPRGFFVSQVKVADDEAAFAALKFTPTELIVDRGEPVNGTPCVAPVITTENRPEEVEQQLTACSEGAVVLGDAWYPGWTVEVDGAPAEVLRAWGFVRAVRVSAGPHRIVWRYQPLTFRVGAAISGVALLALVLTLVLRRRA